jgi:glutathione S-transferase
MASPKLVVHHLQVGQGERIPWLLEELGLPYELKLYKRSHLLSPPELQAKYPIGASPVLEDLTDPSNSVTLAESGAICEYIIYKYANGRLALPPTHKNFSDYLYWFHFSNATLLNHVLRRALSRGMASDASDPRYQGNNARVVKDLEHMNNRLLTTNKWFAGDDFTAADIMLGFCLTTMRQFEAMDFTEYKGIQNWLKLTGEREGYRRAMKKSDPELDIEAGLSATGPKVMETFVHSLALKK